MVKLPNYNHHHHHVVPQARISLTLSRHFSQSFIASGKSSGLHLVSSHSCCMHIRAGRSAYGKTPKLHSLNLFLYLHLSIQSQLWFNRLAGSKYIIICIFSSRPKLHLPSKQLGVIDLSNILHIYIYIYIYGLTLFIVRLEWFGFFV